MVIFMIFVEFSTKIPSFDHFVEFLIVSLPLLGPWHLMGQQVLSVFGLVAPSGPWLPSGNWDILATGQRDFFCAHSFIKTVH